MVRDLWRLTNLVHEFDPRGFPLPVDVETLTQFCGNLKYAASYFTPNDFESFNLECEEKGERCKKEY